MTFVAGAMNATVIGGSGAGGSRFGHRVRDGLDERRGGIDAAVAVGRVVAGVAEVDGARAQDRLELVDVEAGPGRADERGDAGDVRGGHAGARLTGRSRRRATVERRSTPGAAMSIGAPGAREVGDRVVASTALTDTTPLNEAGYIRTGSPSLPDGRDHQDAGVARGGERRLGERDLLGDERAAEAQVDDVGAVLARPVDGVEDVRTGRGTRRSRRP